MRMDFHILRKNSRSNWLYLALVGVLAFAIGSVSLYGSNYETQEVEVAAVKFAGKSSKAQKKTPEFSFEPRVLVPKLGVGGSVSFDVQVAFLNGFNSTETNLWVKGLPKGVTSSYMPNPLPHQGAAVLTIKGEGTEEPGEYSVSLGATAGGITRSQEVILIVSSEPDFSISISPKTQTVAAGGSVSYELSLDPINGFSDEVNLSILDALPGIHISFTQNPITATSTARLEVAASSKTSQREYAFTINGTSKGITHSAEVVLHVQAHGSRWAISSIGKLDARINTLRVGTARNDGIGRIYVGTIETGRVFEFSRDGTGWSNPLAIGGSPTGQEIHNMTIGTGRNDGVLRIYAGSVDDNLYEFTFDGVKWIQTTVGAPHGDALHAVVGDGRNDGVHRLYAVRGIEVFEYTWTGEVWNEIRIGKVSRGVAHGIALGGGRDDGENYIYVASTGSGVYEGVFRDGAWSLTSMGDSGDVRNVGIGDGRSEGKNHVYGAFLAGGRVREFIWNGSKWTFKNLTANIGEKLVHAYVLAGRGDGVKRVYSSGSNGNAYEFSWNGSGWDKYTLGGGTGYMYGFHFGDGRNDGVTRLYGGSFNTRVYEYTWLAP